MEWLEGIASNIYRCIISDESPQNVVLRVDEDQYKGRRVHYREHGIMLFGAGDCDDDNNNGYEIIISRPCEDNSYELFSLFRANDLNEAEARFTILKDKMPILVQICTESCTVAEIQRLSETLLNYPTWTLAHLAAYLALSDAFDNPIVLAELNSNEVITGVSPIQVAIQANHLQIVQRLIDANVSLEHLDYSGNTIYHYAAASSEDIIFILGDRLPNHLNSPNISGQFPLHIACQSGKPDCVRALLIIGADVNISASASTVNNPSYAGDFIGDKPDLFFTDDMKHGGTPLHWSTKCETVNALIQMNCNIDALNFDGRTALHIMVIRQRLECVVALLSHMASINIADKDGNTPLHLAAADSGSLPIINILIGFGANIEAKNYKNESPRHLVNIKNDDSERILYALHAVGAQRCESTMKDCTICCAYDGIFNGTAPHGVPTFTSRSVLDQMLHLSNMNKMASQATKNKKMGKLLCLDGGGIRALILVQILLAIETLTQKSIGSCFDWIAGTSTGGILALEIGCGKTLRECQALYFRLKHNAFVGSRPYNSESLENVFKECFGADTVMADIKDPKFMISAVLADRRPVDLHFFRNYQSPSHLMNIPQSSQFEATLPPDKQRVWKVARATGAAPSYFRAFGRFLDGGLIANNPTLDAMTEINEYNSVLTALGRDDEVIPLSLVVSLGTGAELSEPLNDIDVFRPATVLDAMKLGKSISTIIKLIVDQMSSTDGRIVDRARAWCSAIGALYYRFNPQLAIEVPLDETNNEILADMIWRVAAFLHANKDDVKELAAILCKDS